MGSQLPLDVQQMVEFQLAKGLYSDSDEVLREALHLLVEHQATMDDLQSSVDDIGAGRVLPLDEVLADIRQRHGWSS
jgi:putative addiction module CopG family antidote